MDNHSCFKAAITAIRTNGLANVMVYLISTKKTGQAHAVLDVIRGAKVSDNPSYVTGLLDQDLKLDGTHGNSNPKVEPFTSSEISNRGITAEVLARIEAGLSMADTLQAIKRLDMADKLYGKYKGYENILFKRP